MSRPPRGGVDRNLKESSSAGDMTSRPPRGGVDRNIGNHPQSMTCRVAPLAGAWIETR